MSLQFVGDFVNRCERRSGELELAARLERNRALADLVIEPDQAGMVVDRRPAEARLHALQQGLDAAAPFVGHRRRPGLIEHDLLVLGADAKLLGRLAALLKPARQLVPRFNDFSVADVTRHEPP